MHSNVLKKFCPIGVAMRTAQTFTLELPLDSVKLSILQSQNVVSSFILVMFIHATFTSTAHRELILFGDMQIEKQSTIREPVTLIIDERKKHIVHRNENEIIRQLLSLCFNKLNAHHGGCDTKLFLGDFRKNLQGLTVHLRIGGNWLLAG